MADGWTPERRARQAALIRTWRSWERSTGPRTPAGKATAANNADKGSASQLLRVLGAELRGVLRQQRELLDELQQRR